MEAQLRNSTVNKSKSPDICKDTRSTAYVPPLSAAELSKIKQSASEEDINDLRNIFESATSITKEELTRYLLVKCDDMQSIKPEILQQAPLQV